MIRRTLAAALLVPLLAVACSDDDGADTEPSTTAPTVTDGTDDSVADDTTSTTQPAAEGMSITDALDVGVIDIVTPPSGGGERPLLEWTEVDGAGEYDVVVLTEDGEPYWAWVGQTNSVVFGGGDPDGEPGQLAVVHGPLTWTVAAFDAAGDLLALSERIPLAP